LSDRLFGFFFVIKPIYLPKLNSTLRAAIISPFFEKIFAGKIQILFVIVEKLLSIPR